MLDISTIILTYNEQLHIERCISNAQRYAQEVFVVDSFSTDDTVAIARRMGAHVVQHAFTTHADQFNWALQHLPLHTEWVWKQDADEYLSDELIDELQHTVPTMPPDINGYTARCERIFMGRHIKHGIVPLILLRLFRREYAHVEKKMMDEHVVLSQGTTAALQHPFYDDNRNNLAWWTQKHNGYADKEAIELLLTKYGMHDAEVVNSGAHAQKVRKKKLRYTRLPLFWRAFAFFCYRYFLRLGFLDGKEGFLWHFLQGFWYRTLADAKAYEIEKNLQHDPQCIRQYLQQRVEASRNAAAPSDTKNAIPASSTGRAQETIKA